MKETGLTGKGRSTTIAATPCDGKSQRKRRLSSCDYEEQKETNLRDRIVFGVADMRAKERLLR